MRAQHSTSPEQAFAAATQGRGFNGKAVDPKAVKMPALRPEDLDLGKTAVGVPVGLHLPKLLLGRLLIQGNSGAGKSWLLRRLFEQAFGRVQQLVIDVEGEFSTLREHFDIAIVAAAEADRVGGRTFALHLREHRYSAVLDLSDADSEDQLRLVADVAGGLIDAPSQHWHPLLVLVDEAQAVAPHYDTGDVETETRKRAISALASLMGRGRKRGIAGVIATQRLAETSKAVCAKPTNVIVGRTFLDRDLERAGALLGFTVGQSRPIRTLADGEFLCLGPALAGPTRMRFRAGPTVSTHKGDAPAVVPPPVIGAAAAAALLQQIPTAEASPAPAETHARQRGRRGRDWRPEEDKIIRDGYAARLPVAAIGEQLAQIGFSTSTSNISMRAHALGLVSAKAHAAWSDAEDAIIRAGYERELKIIDIVTALAENGFSRGRVAVQMRAIALGITRDRVNYWTEEESKIALAGLNAGKSTREIIVDLKNAGFVRGVTGITKFAQKHGISRNSAIPWGDDDIAKLTELYTANKSVAEIMQELDRSRGAILSMASQLGLKQRKPWTDQEKAILRKAHAAGKKLIDCPALLPGRTYATVARMAGQLRLSFPQKRAP